MQRAARPLTASEFTHIYENDLFPEWDYVPGTPGNPFEYEKREDWGWFEGRVVAVDYAAPYLIGPDG